MNWIKENKFLSGVFAVLLLGVGTLGYLLFTALGSFDEATATYTQQAGELSRLQNLPLSPNRKNLDALIAQKKEAVAVVAAFQASLAADSFPLEPMTPEQFQDKLKATKTAVLERAAQGGTELLPAPAKFYLLGADTYEGRPPAPEAAAPLGRELKAIEWVLNQLFDNRVTKLEPIKREPLAEETGRKSGGERKGKPLVSTHSFEIKMQCRQNAFASVLNVIAGPKAPQFFITRVVQVKNQKPSVPKAVAFTPPPPSPPLPAGTPPTTTPPATPPPPKPIAAYIVGDEQLEVTLVIDIVDFAEPAAASSK